MRVPVVLVFISAVVWAQTPAKPAPRVQLTPAKEAPPATPELAKADRLLADGLKDKNPDVRREAVAAVGLAGTREPYLGEIHAALEDKDVQVRLAAVASLVDLERKNSAPGLIKALYDETPEVSFAAAKALWTLGDPTGKAALLAVISGDSKTSSGPITAKTREMLRMFQTPRTLTMFAIREGSGMIPFPGVGAGVSSLTLLMTDQGASGRSTAVLAVGKDKSPEVVKALIEALSDKDTSVRASALHSLAVHDDPQFIEQIIPLMDDYKDAVRFRAAAAYIRLTGIQRTQWDQAHKPKAVAPAKPAAVPAKK